VRTASAEIGRREAERHRGESVLSRVENLPPGADAVDLHVVACSVVNVMVTASDAADRGIWARTIHENSARRDRPFVAVSGQAAPASDGAGSIDAWFGQAAGGTLFIDRVGDLSIRAQERLLLLLAEQSPPANGTIPHADRGVRVVTGSNRSLSADLARGAFSDALFYRLNMIHIDLMNRNASGERA
jgi:DNA-binding NtrC family response regulator